LSSLHSGIMMCPPSPLCRPRVWMSSKVLPSDSFRIQVVLTHVCNVQYVCCVHLEIRECISRIYSWLINIVWFWAGHSFWARFC
jgi:hypothetical protein